MVCGRVPLCYTSHPMSDLTNPHDKFFKETFGRVEVARDFLRNYLPAPVLTQLNLSQIQLEKETFIDLYFRLSHSLTKARTNDQSSSLVFVP